MRCYVTLSTIAALAVVLAGCAAPAPEITSPNVTLEVKSAAGVEGGCMFFNSKDKFCHTFVVHIVNGNAKENVDNNMFYWEATSANGSVVKVPSKEGPDAVAPGHEITTTLKFDTTDAARLVNLTYKAIWMREPVFVTIPTYAVQPWVSGVTLTVTKAEIQPENCGGYGTDSRCHAFTVHVVNGNAKESIEKSTFKWKGKTATGNVFNAYYSSEGPDAIAPGAEGDFVIKFDMSTDAKLAQLVYEDSLWMLRPAAAQVSTY